MALPKDPTQYPAARWSLHSVYQPLDFSPAYLETLRAMETDPHAPGHSDAGIRNMLFSLTLSFKPDSVLELGTHIGSAAVVIGEALRLNDFGKLYTVESTNECHGKASAYVERAGLQKQVTCIKGFSYEEPVRKQLAQAAPFEIIYVDACHDFDAVFGEIQYYSTILRDDGLMIFHDTSLYAQSYDTKQQGGVRRAIVEACGRAPELVPIFFEWPYWLNNCGAAIVCKQSIVNREAFASRHEFENYSAGPAPHHARLKGPASLRKVARRLLGRGA